MNSGTCPGCGQRVLWALTVNRKRLALNPDPDPDGNQASYRDGTGTRLTRQLREGEEPYRYERRYMPHVATCKGTGRAPAPAPLPSNVIPFRRKGRKSKAG